MSYRGDALKAAGIDSGLRFFARLRTFDIACPRCDRVQTVKPSTNRRIWDPRTARFQCLGCFATYHLGMVVWLAKQGKYKTPDDQTPTVTQALQLRRQLNVYLQTRLMKGRDTNLVYDELPGTESLVKD